jgi:hypothetical protein
MRSSVFVLGLALGTQGCGFQSQAAGPGPDDAAPVDGARPGSDADPVADSGSGAVIGDGCMTFSSQLDTCALPAAADLAILINATYDTNLGELKAGSLVVPTMHMRLTTKDGQVDAIIAHNVTLSPTVILRAIGSVPFAIIATGTISLQGTAQINVADGGAGAPNACSTLPSPGADRPNSAGGGGGGGGFGAAGGNGGAGNKDAATIGIGNGSSTIPPGLRGGCPGARGGVGGAPGGTGGLAGGALYLVAAGAIQLGDGAVLTAGGGGGNGGALTNSTSAAIGNAGGGGGGSGGMIMLEAPHIVGMTAKVAANGGGGGEGSDTNNAGKPGITALTTAEHAPGGRDAVAEGSDGGAGGSALGPAGGSVTEQLNGGGGGGGGSVGYIRIVSGDIQLSSVSPVAQP